MNFKPIILVISSQNLLIDNFIENLKSDIYSEKSKILYSSYHFDRSEIDKIIIDSKSPSMFYEKKFLLIKNIDSKYSFPLIDSLSQNPPSFLTAVLTTDNKKKEFLKFESLISIIDLDSNSKFDQEVKNEADKLGLKLSNTAVNSLISLLGENLNLIRNELEKLSISNIGNQISEKDITNLIQKQNYNNPYSLLSAVAARDLKKSLEIMSELEKKGEDPIGILSLLSWRLRQIFKAIELTKDKASHAQIAKALKISNGAVYYVLKDSKKFNNTELKRLLKLMSEVDLKIKSTNESSFTLLNRFIINICLTKSGGLT
ncbi:MAG: DNA polymerase III subunit delta [Thermodesulfobacteriota bacterium]